jgi:hypothetical protein
MGLPADTIQVYSRAALGGNDLIDWGQLGPFVPQPSIPDLPNDPESVFSSGGISVSAYSPDGIALDQQAFSTVYCNCANGNFAPGDYLLEAGTDAPSFPSLTLTFSDPVYGVGTQMDLDQYGPFTGTMQLFDPQGDSLGSYTVLGNTADTADNSAVFIGALSSDPIGSVTFSSSYALLINDVDLVTTPEPGSIFLVLTGVVALGRATWRREGKARRRQP